MPIYINCGGVSSQLASIYNNINGSRKSDINAYVNINNSSKEIFGLTPYHQFIEYKLTTDGILMYDLVEETLSHTGTSFDSHYVLWTYTTNNGNNTDEDAEFYVSRSYTFNHNTKILSLNSPTLVTYNDLTNMTINSKYSGYYAILNNRSISFNATGAPTSPNGYGYAWYMIYLEYCTMNSASDVKNLYVTRRYSYYEDSFHNPPYYLWAYDYNRDILTQSKDHYTESTDATISAEYKYSNNTYTSGMAEEYVYKYNGIIYK